MVVSVQFCVIYLQIFMFWSDTYGLSPINGIRTFTKYFLLLLFP
jgi:hypothetical protein